MKVFVRCFFCLSFVVLSFLLSGCVTRDPHAEFVRSIDFSPLQSFAYKRTFTPPDSNMRHSDKRALEALSKSVVSEALMARGFLEKEADGADFYVVTRWRKSMDPGADIFDSIDGPMQTMNRRNKPGYEFRIRYHVIVEVYEAASDQLFWRSELRSVFEALQFTEERVAASLERAMANFPERIERDPDLPDIL